MTRNRLHRMLAPLALVLAAAPLSAQHVPTPQVRARVDSLLARMTLEEKIGQMTQLTIQNFLAPGPQTPDNVRLDPAKLRQGIVDRHIGSILNAPDFALTVDGWHSVLRQIQDVATRETRLKIPILYGVDAMHGVTYGVGATIFPHHIGMAATFDSALTRQEGEVTARELTAAGLPWNFAPVMDLGRQPLWPRFYETLGEDAFAASRLGRSEVAGMEASGRVATSLKHYLAYGGPTSGQDRAPAFITTRMVREQFLPTFREAVKAGARSVMVNSGSIDGDPVHASHYWLTDVLRKELGFQGVVVSDWQDVIFLNTRHRVAPTLKDATRMAVLAGLDMSMTPNDYGFEDQLLELVKEGSIPESRIDESVRRILILKAELGLFDHPYPDASLKKDFAVPASKELARRAARESMTLLKNDGVLPLRPGTRVLVTGPAAKSLTALNGGWTYTWQGTDASRFPAGIPTIFDAIRERAAEVRYAPGSGFTKPGDVDAAVKAAAGMDVAVVAIGEDAYAEGVGDIDDLTLPEPQLRLAQAIEATGVPTVLVLVEGRPRIIRPIVDGAKAVLMAYWPGMEGAQAVADMLFGAISPSGRLPFTYPRFPNVLVAYDHMMTENIGPSGEGDAFNPQFAYGTGLGYTTFAYSDLTLGADSIAPADRLKVEVTVTNTGKRAGDDVVLMFTHQHYASLTPAVRRLRGFERVALAPGASRKVTFTLGADELSFVGRDGTPVLEPGAFDVMVGGLSKTFRVVGPATRSAGTN